MERKNMKIHFLINQFELDRKSGKSNCNYAKMIHFGNEVPSNTK